jgi:hypothetical protein
MCEAYQRVIKRKKRALIERPLIHCSREKLNALHHFDVGGQCLTQSW